MQSHGCTSPLFHPSTGVGWMAGVEGGGAQPHSCDAGRVLGFGVWDPQEVSRVTRKVDVRPPGKGDSNSHGVRPVHDDEVDSDQ